MDVDTSCSRIIAKPGKFNDSHYFVMSHARSVRIRRTRKRERGRERDGRVFADATGAREILMQRSRCIAQKCPREFSRVKLLNNSL